MILTLMRLFFKQGYVFLSKTAFHQLFYIQFPVYEKYSTLNLSCESGSALPFTQRNLFQNAITKPYRQQKHLSISAWGFPKQTKKV